jgi:cell division protein FtsW (lipid II flippase)
MASRATQQGLFFRLHIDFTLLMGIIVLLIIGLVILYSASGENMAMMQRQGIRLGVAFIVMFAIAQISPDSMRRWSPLIFICGVIMLVAVLFVGTRVLGAQRWLDLGLFRFQPSEMMKLAVPMMLAWFMAGGNIPSSKWRLLLAIVFLLLPVLLIAKQPDLGTSLLVTSAGLFVIFMSGVSWRLILIFIIAGVGVSNTMMMGIFERKYEVGMMRSLGMTDRDIMKGLILEAMGIGFIGLTIGVILAIPLNIFLVNHGIDYGFMLKDFDVGYRTTGVLHGKWKISSFIYSALAGLSISGIMAIIPSRRILKKSISENLRTR